MKRVLDNFSVLTRVKSSFEEERNMGGGGESGPWLGFFVRLTVLVSWFWEVVFFIAATFCIYSYIAYIPLIHSWLLLFLIVIFGLLPAHQLRHAVEAHRPNRMIFWMVSMLSQILASCCFCITWAIRRTHPPAHTPGSWHKLTHLWPGGCQDQQFWLALFITAVVAITITITAVVIGPVLTTYLLLLRKSKADCGPAVVEEVVGRHPAGQQGMFPADTVAEQLLECPKCGTCAGSEEYYNNSDNICYLTYCTKCVHEHGVYINLEKHEEKQEELQRTRKAAERWRRNAEKLRRSREEEERQASSPYQACPLCGLGFPGSRIEAHAATCGEEHRPSQGPQPGTSGGPGPQGDQPGLGDPLARILEASSPYQVLGLREGVGQEEARAAYRLLLLAVHPDKNPHPRAGEAFARVQLASKQLKVA